MTLRSLSVAVVLSLAPMAVPVVVHAQPATDAAHVKAARTRFQAGVRAYDKKEYEKARAAFLEAYRLRAHPALFLNIAQSSLRTGRLLEAARDFRRFLREASPAPAAAATAQQGLAEADEKLGRLEVRAEPGLDVSVDGTSVGKTPLPEVIELEPGSHQVRVGAGDHPIIAVAGQPTVVSLVPAPAAFAAGDERSPQAVAGKPATAASTPGAFARPASLVPVYIAGGLAIAGVATGIAMIVGRSQAQSKADSATSLIDTHGGGATTCASTDPTTVAKFGDACSALSTDNSQASTDGTIRDVAFIVAGVAVVGGLVYYVVAPKAQSGSPAGDARPASAGVHLDVLPLLTRTTQGLSLGGSF